MLKFSIIHRIHPYLLEGVSEGAWLLQDVSEEKSCERREALEARRLPQL